MDRYAFEMKINENGLDEDWIFEELGQFIKKDRISEDMHRTALRIAGKESLVKRPSAKKMNGWKFCMMTIAKMFYTYQNIM